MSTTEHNNSDRSSDANDPGSRGSRSDSEWSAWLSTVSGDYLLNWEQTHIDECVGDIFGFNAFQCGMPELAGLRANRMPLRGVVLGGAVAPPCASDSGDGHGPRVVDPPLLKVWPTVLVDQFEALPFESQSLDLLILPHALEFSVDPHQLLRETERVLRPEGRLIIFGLNPFSLWGARHWLANWFFKASLPKAIRMIPLSRLHDWLKLLDIEFDRASFACYRPLVQRQSSWRRSWFFEPVGDRFWPVCGAVYCVSAVKRVAGMRLIGPAWKGKRLSGKFASAQGVRTSKEGQGG
jgi:SAM-dependent methyltransferase